MLCCAVCSMESEHLILQSTNSFGSPDLDTRPAPMMRNTMEKWTLRCPSCGYAASDITEAEVGAAEIVQGEEYQALLQDEALPALARTFMAESHLQEWLGDLRNAVRAAIHAAWVHETREAEIVPYRPALKLYGSLTRRSARAFPMCRTRPRSLRSVRPAAVGRQVCGSCCTARWQWG